MISEHFKEKDIEKIRDKCSRKSKTGMFTDADFPPTRDSLVVPNYPVPLKPKVLERVESIKTWKRGPEIFKNEVSLYSGIGPNDIY
jgi:hypothetical protein